MGFQSWHLRLSNTTGTVPSSSRMRVRAEQYALAGLLLAGGLHAWVARGGSWRWRRVVECVTGRSRAAIRRVPSIQ
jgi:hypothetical protein